MPAPPLATVFHIDEQEPAALDVIKTLPKLPEAKATRAKLDAILAQPEYSASGTPGQPTLLQRFLEWLARMFSRFGYSPPSWVGLIIMLAVILALAYLLVRLIWEWQARRSRTMAQETAEGEIVLGAEALLKAAAEAAAQGDYRLAIRLRFKWLLSVLNPGESALLTNRQLALRLSREHPGVREPLKQLITCFEDAWYGMLPCGEAELARALQLTESVRAQAGEAVP